MDLRDIRGRWRSRSVGSTDARSRTTIHLPWDFYRADGVFQRVGEAPWLYCTIPTVPLRWADEDERLQVGGKLHHMLCALGETSRLPMASMPAFADNRHIHLIAITLDAPPEIPTSSSPEHAMLLQDLFPLVGNVPTRACLLGVRCMAPRLMDDPTSGSSSVESWLELGKIALGVASSDLDLYAEDIDRIKAIVYKHGARVPSESEANLLKSWYNRGKGNGAMIVAHPTWLDVRDTQDKIEFATVRKFTNPIQKGTNYTWASAAASHASGAVVVSIKGQLEPASVVVKRMLATQRRQRSMLMNSASSGDLEDETQISKFHLQRDVDQFLRTQAEAVLVRTSIVMARYARKTTESYIDHLNNQYQIAVRPHWNRQISALRECMPCSDVQLERFEQPMSISAVAYAGIGSFGELGDGRGLLMGMVDPDLALCYLDPERSAAGTTGEQSPGVGILGDTGSGKTVLMQWMAYQSALLGRRAIYVNPKPKDDLAGLVELTARWRHAEKIVVGDAGAEPGSFDPFRFATPEYAHIVASTYILDVLGPQWGHAQQIALSRGLMKAAMAGVRSTGEALQHFVEDRDVVGDTLGYMEANPTFALGIAMRPRPDMTLQGGLTLIQFDQSWPDIEPMADPSKQPLSELVQLAIMRLIPRAALEILLSTNSGAGSGGDLYIDEAHRLFSTTAGRKFIERQGREGRSQGVMTVLATQRPSDLVNAGVEPFLGRVVTMKLRDAEARVGLQLVGMADSPDRVAAMAHFGPEAPHDGLEAKPAQCFMRDMEGRHAGMIVHPIPAPILAALSTSRPGAMGRTLAMS